MPVTSAVGGLTLVAVVRNALSAYAIFQDWGNDPSRYRSATLGERVLRALTVGAGPGPTPANLEQAFDLLPAVTPTANRMRWDWLFEDVAAGYQVIALDTRTWRTFPAPPNGPKADAGLIASDPSLSDSQLASPGGPALGFQLVARIPTDGRLTFVISPTPVLGHPAVELSLRGLGTASRNASWPEIQDNEAWAGNRVAFEDMLRRLASLGRVVLLSGDVHYSFTAEGTYFDTPEMGPGRASRIVQLCSSSLRNQDDNTLMLGRVGFGTLTELGWLGFRRSTAGSRTTVLAGLTLEVGLPGQLATVIGERFDAPSVLPDRHYAPAALAEVQRLVGQTTPPAGRTDWRYLIRYLRDPRSPENQLAGAGVPLSALGSDPRLREALITASVIGTNNLGRVTLTTGAGGPTAVVHELHWWLGTGGATQPTAPMVTRHEASLRPPVTTDLPVPRP
jgi:hypothetical protein